MMWETSYSVLVNASLQKAWEFHSHIEENWKRIEGDAVEYMRLHGPYKAGTTGSTKMKGQPPTDWQLIEVEPLAKSVTEFLLPDAKIHFEFRFDKVSESECRMSQKIVLLGEDAAQYIPIMEENFGKTLEAGMNKIALEMAKYADS